MNEPRDLPPPGARRVAPAAPRVPSARADHAAAPAARPPAGPRVPPQPPPAPTGSGTRPGAVPGGPFVASGSAAEREPLLLTHDDALDARNSHGAARPTGRGRADPPGRPVGPPPGRPGVPGPPPGRPGVPGPPPGPPGVPPGQRRVGAGRWTGSSNPGGRAPTGTRVGPRTSPPGRPVGPGGPGGPPPYDPYDTGGGGGGDGGGDGGGPGHGRGGRRGGRLRRVLLWTLALGLVGPLLAFAAGWLVFEVPTPDDAATSQVATVSFADGSELAKIVPAGNVNRQKVSLSQVPQPVRYAVLAAEDRSFYSNPGFDPVGIARAVWNQLTGGRGGGSTITQQYIKVTTGQDQISLFRKYKEIVLAAKISKVRTKDQILEDYLNTIYFGRGAYGIQAAAQGYFGVSSEQLTESQGALLAGMVQSPSRWDPAKNPAKATERWNFVLDGMVAQNWLPKAERVAMRFPDWIPPKPAAGGIPTDARGHLYTQVKGELESKGISDQELNQEGLVISTTIDPAMQKLAVDTSAKVLRGQPKNLRTALVSIDPRSGAILAYYGGENGVGLDYAQVLKQPGSSFKPFVMAAALERDPPIGLGERFDGSSPQTIAGQPVSNSEGVDCDNCSLKKAMTSSINTIFYQLAVDVGPSSVADAAHQAGIPADLLPTPTAGIALGDKEVHPIDMAAAFGTFAADGVYHKPHMITKVETADGRVLYDEGASRGEQRMSAQVARNVTESMVDVASSSGIGMTDGRAVAAKTGTVQSRIEGQNNDAWTVGYTPSVSTAVWVGTDDNTPIKNSGGRPIYGRMLPGSIWQQFMNGALRNKPKEPFSRLVPLGEPAFDEDDSSETQDPDSDSDEENRDDDEDSDRDRGRRDRDSEDSDRGNRFDGTGNPFSSDRDEN